MKRSIQSLIYVLFFVMFCALAMKNTPAIAADEKESVEEFIVPVFSTLARTGVIKESIKITGTIYSLNSVKISSKVSGEIENIYYDEGDVIKAQDVLLKIDDETIKLRLQQATEGEKAASEVYSKTEAALKLEEEQTELQIKLAGSNLEAAKALFDKAKAGARPEEKKQAEASMLAAKAAMNNAEGNYKRIAELYNKKTISKQQYDLEKMQLDVAKAQHEIAKENFNLVEAGLRKEDIQSAESNYQSANTALQIAESLKLKLKLLENDISAALSNRKQAEVEKKIASIMLDDTNVRSPIDGIISKKYVEEGEIIQAPGIPLFT
ncbi:HlyD family secretion protein, partial [Thermodesulfobacteriota bacterium]